MKNKYEEYINELTRKKEKITYQILNNLKGEYTNKFNQKSDISNFSFIIDKLINYNSLEHSEKEWVNNRLLPSLSKHSLIVIFLIMLNSLEIKKDYKKIEIFCDALKEIGIIDEINYNKDTREFIIKQKDNSEIKVCSLYNQTEDGFNQMYVNNGNCHSITYKVAEKWGNNINVVTVIEKGIIGSDEYHSFIVNKNNVIIDFAHGFCMDYNDYLALTDAQVIYNIKGESFVKIINDMINHDEEFNNNNSKIINYLIYTKGI